MALGRMRSWRPNFVWTGFAQYVTGALPIGRQNLRGAMPADRKRKRERSNHKTCGESRTDLLERHCPPFASWHIIPKRHLWTEQRFPRVRLYFSNDCTAKNLGNNKSQSKTSPKVYDTAAHRTNLTAPGHITECFRLACPHGPGRPINAARSTACLTNSPPSWRI
jgi:hypothetical protein